jgi:hypothetical protein
MTSTTDRTKHFDAPRPASPFTGALGLLKARWAVVSALVVALAIVGGAAFGLLFVDRLVTAGIEASVAATPVFVLLDTRATASEAEALGARIRALPGVADATLRTRDDALRALVATGLPAPDGRNPLPDVWTVRLKTPPTGGLSAALATLRSALAALPLVVATRVDERWVARLDQWMSASAASGPMVRPAGVALLLLLLASLGFVGGKAASAADNPSKLVLAIAGTLVAAMALVIDALSIWAIGTFREPAAGMLIDTTWATIAGDGLVLAVAACVFLLVLAVTFAGSAPGNR